MSSMLLSSWNKIKQWYYETIDKKYNKIEVVYVKRVTQLSLAQTVFQEELYLYEIISLL